jgi:hypothetical protein
MIHGVFLRLTLLPAVLSLSLPVTLKDCQRQAVGGAIGLMLATGTVPLSPAQAAEVIKVDADIPALIQIAKDNKDTAWKLAQQTAGAVKISDYPKSYANIINFARDVAAGDVFVQLNGAPIDISLLSDKGALDIDLSTEFGDLSLTVTSSYLPKLPFLSKRVVSIPSETAGTSAVDTSTATESTKPVRTRAAAALLAASQPKVPLLDRPVFVDMFENTWTVKQILGTTSLGLGVAYASSYAYYIKSIEDEEKAMAEKKRKAATKAKAAVSKNVEGPLASETDKSQKPSPAVEEVSSKVVTKSTSKAESKASASKGGWLFWKKN